MFPGKWLGIRLEKIDNANMVLMDERDLERIKDEWRQSCNQN